MTAQSPSMVAVHVRTATSPRLAEQLWEAYYAILITAEAYQDGDILMGELAEGHRTVFIVEGPDGQAEEEGIPIFYIPFTNVAGSIEAIQELMGDMMSCVFVVGSIEFSTLAVTHLAKTYEQVAPWGVELVDKLDIIKPGQVMWMLRSEQTAPTYFCSGSLKEICDVAMNS